MLLLKQTVTLAKNEKYVMNPPKKCYKNNK